MSKRRLIRPDQHVQDIVAKMKSFPRHRPERVLGDFAEMAALAISNKWDLRQYERREARYMEIVKDYTRDEGDDMVKMLGQMVLILSEGPQDAFGRIWAGLELSGKWKGQFFTPYEVSHMMANIVFHDLDEQLKDGGFVTACEPCCGPGGMIAAMAHGVQDAGYDYKTQLHVTAIDIDPRCVHMAYIQASILGIPAAIYLGDTIRHTFSDTWFTPAHIAGGWSAKLGEASMRDAAIREWSKLQMPDRIAALQAHGVADLGHATSDVPPASIPADALLAAE